MMVFAKRQDLSKGWVLSALMGVRIVLGMTVLALPGSAWAQMSPQDSQGGETQALLDRIDRLERDIRTLNLQLVGRKTPKIIDGGTATSSPETSTPKVEFTNGEGVVSRVMVRVMALEEEVRNATGVSETMAHNIDQLSARLDKFMVDLDFRLRRLEAAVPAVTSGNASGMAMPETPPISAAPSPGVVSKVGAMPPVSSQSGVLGVMPKAELDQIVNANKDGQENAGKSVGEAGTGVSGAAVSADTVVSTVANGSSAEAPGDGVPQSASLNGVSSQRTAEVSPASPATPKISAQDQYKAAFNLTRQARYKEAEIAFKTFLQMYGDDKLAGNANYWLGETYYVRKDYMQAAQVFFQAYQKFPQGPKAEDSLLKLGMSMAGLNKITEACATYGKLRKEFGADMKPNIERALNKETKRLKCK